MEPYRRNFLEMLRMGKPGSEAYYLSRVIVPVGDAEFGGVLENVRRTGYPAERLAYTLERTAIRVRDLPGGMILTLLAFFAPPFALVWASKNLSGGAGAGTVFFVALGLAAAGCLMLISAVLIVAAVRSINE